MGKTQVYVVYCPNRNSCKLEFYYLLFAFLGFGSSADGFRNIRISRLFCIENTYKHFFLLFLRIFIAVLNFSQRRAVFRKMSVFTAFETRSTVGINAFRVVWTGSGKMSGLTANKTFRELVYFLRNRTPFQKMRLKISQDLTNNFILTLWTCAVYHHICSKVFPFFLACIRWPYDPFSGTSNNLLFSIDQ